MFILIPFITIFLLLSYIYMNEVNIYGQALIYGFCLFIIVLSSYIHKAIKKDILQQEINRLEADKHLLEKRILETQDDQRIDQLKNAIKKIQNEIDTKLQNK